MRAASILARAASPTRAATSTKSRSSAATIFNPIADIGDKSIENSSVSAELFARTTATLVVTMPGRNSIDVTEQRTVAMAAVIHKKGPPENFVWEQIEAGSPARGGDRP